MTTEAKTTEACMPEGAHDLSVEEAESFLTAYQGDRRLLGDHEAFLGVARDIWDAALANQHAKSKALADAGCSESEVGSAPADARALAAAAAALVQAVQRDWPNTTTHRTAVLAAAAKVQRALTHKPRAKVPPAAWPDAADWLEKQSIAAYGNCLPHHAEAAQWLRNTSTSAGGDGATKSSVMQSEERR